MKRIITLILVAIAMALPGAAFAEGLLNLAGGPLELGLTAEGGFVKILSHTIEVGDTTTPGTEFDYVKQGGQEILFPFSRFTSELTVNKRHTIVLLYQPLLLQTQSVFDADVTVDGVDFEAGQVVDITYSFPFYRASYLYDFAAADNLELAAGVSFQLRNASVRFVSQDNPATGGNNVGEASISQDLGPVPILKIRAGYQFEDAAVPGAFVELEADGFYASSAFFNGAEYPFSGSIFDASLRAGFSPQPGLEVFANLRGLGGGANGTRPPDDNRFWTQSAALGTDNFLTTLSLTLGARIR